MDTMSNTIEKTITTVNDSVTERLDALESTLPTIPSKALAATRASARRVNATIESAGCSIRTRVENVRNEADAATSTSAGQARAAVDRSASTVAGGVRRTTGQARAAAERVADTVARGVKETTGQARANIDRSTASAKRGVAETRGQAVAQSRRVANAAGDNVEGALDDAKVAADPDQLSKMTKAELYERAQDLDIEGRSAMTKAELIGAIQKA